MSTDLGVTVHNEERAIPGKTASFVVQRYRDIALMATPQLLTMADFFIFLQC